MSSTTTLTRPAQRPAEPDESPLRFVVWIDDNCGYGTPNWEMDDLYCRADPSEPLPQALEHAAHTRSLGYPSLLVLPGQTPRPDGLFQSP